jgi:TPR repeat protein
MAEAVHSPRLIELRVAIFLISYLTLLTGCEQRHHEKTIKLDSIPLSVEAEKQADISDDEVFSKLKKQAETGDAQAQRDLGRMYKNGKGTSTDVAKAFEWIQKSADQGHAGGQALLGLMYFDGLGTAKNVAKAVEWIRKSAEQGNSIGQAMLAWMYLYGEGLSKNPKKALEFFEKAALQGHPEAQASLADMYRKGVGTPKNFEKVVEWLTKLAEQGDALAQFELANMYLNGEGVSKNFVISYAWSNLAASKDDKFSTFRDLLENRLTQSELQEAQRISSNWKKGEALQATAGLPQISTASVGKLRKQATGTAFMVSNEGHALTNHHVINGCVEVKVNGQKEPVKILASDSVNDLALIQLIGNVSDISRIYSAPEKLRQGDDIVVFGYPLQSALSSSGNLTSGTISALTGLGNNSNQIQITAAIQPGSSGSPVMDKSGAVVGVVSMKLSDSQMLKSTGEIGQNVNFAVNGQTVKTFLDINKVPYKREGFFSSKKSNVHIAEAAQKWTVLLECWK